MTTARVPHPVELELKYRVSDDQAAERYLEVGALGRFKPASPVRVAQVEDRYVDTARGDLARAGFAARLRRTRKGTVVGLKSLAGGPLDGDGSAAHRREEIEGPADESMAPNDWPASDARSLVLELAGDEPLVELVMVRQRRRKRELRDGATRVELSLDDVEVVLRGQVVDRFAELEVELLKGDEARLTALDGAFRADAALRPSGMSKLESALVVIRGHEAAGFDGAETEIDPVPSTSDELPDEQEDGFEPATEPASLPTVKTPGVTADDHVAEAARKVLRFHLARMLAREAGTREGKDNEELHGMRVATRRQRAAWRVFGDAFRHGRTKRYRSGLREIASRLGAVRDLDVLLDAADLYRADLPKTEQRSLEPLLASWRQHRDDARVLLMRELDSDGYQRWVDDYRDFVRTEGAAVLPVGPVEPHRVRDTAPSRIWGAYEHVRGYEPVLRWADVETLHELRIAGKWLRYTLEFVREPLGPDATPLINRVVALQDHLGLMNDANVAANMARTFLVEHAGDLSTQESAAIGRYLVNRERDVARLRRSIGTPWRGVAGVGFRRALGRVVAGL
ncbi:MAG TPA: CHAD domain-containing protein [Candidatus Limnocylindrales bacterium]|nr:CHAD domain-containing protein [Candidatus Limnocylindrales bacterium]